MEGAIKPELNGAPLPQRNQKQHNNAPVIIQDDSGVPEKKARIGAGGVGGGGGGGVAGNNRDGSRGRQRFNRGQGQQRNRNNFKQEGEKMGGGSGGGGGGGGVGFGGERRDNRDRRDDRGRGDRGRKGDDYMIAHKLKEISGPTHELPPIEAEETKFSGRNRLYIGNLTNDITEEELRELFKPFGEISEAFINAEKNFAFLKVDYHLNAEKAKRELDGFMRKNRALRIRFAPNATIVRVKNLTPFVSNELLFKSFEVFGPVERAVIVVDDRGKSTGEGIVEFARKAGAMAALRYCDEKCYFLTASLRPCVVEPFEINDDTDGMPDKTMNKKAQDFFKYRQVGPRFAEIGSFEHEYGTRWKQLHELFKSKHEALKRELEMEEEKLEVQMEYARYEHETELLREQLRMREQDRDRQKMEWEMKERMHGEQRIREEEHMRRQQEDMQLRMGRQEEELRRRQQENTLFVQAQQLNSLLDQQELNQGNSGSGNGGNGGGGNRNFNGGNMNRNFDFGGGDNLGGGGGGGNPDQGFTPFDIGASDSKPNQFESQNQGGGNSGGTGNVGGGGGQMNQRGGNNRPWNNNNERRGGGGNDFLNNNNKRRRF